MSFGSEAGAGRDGGRDNPGVLIFPPLLFALCLLAGIAIHAVTPAGLRAPAWVRGAGLAMAVGAIVHALWGERTMKAAGTNVRPSLPALAIVRSGPFAYSRNPLYLSLVLLLAGIGIAVPSIPILAMVIPLVAVLRFGVIAREERYLAEKFGQTYRDYQRTVRRWF